MISIPQAATAENADRTVIGIKVSELICVIKNHQAFLAEPAINITVPFYKCPEKANELDRLKGRRFKNFLPDVKFQKQENDNNPSSAEIAQAIKEPVRIWLFDKNELGCLIDRAGELVSTQNNGVTVVQLPVCLSQ